MEHPHTSRNTVISDAEDSRRTVQSPAKVDEHGPSCFGCEEEKGATWTGAGGMHPEIEEKRPRL